MGKTGKDKTCQSCGSTFYVPAWREAHGKIAKFCSVACKTKFGSPLKGVRFGITTACAHCGTQYYVEANRSGITKYCSVKCNGLARTAAYKKAKSEPPKTLVKACSKCGIEKALSEFPRRASAFDGVRADCRVCFAEQQVRWREANAEKKKATDRRIYLENKEARKKSGAEYYVKNKPSIVERNKSYYALTKPDFVARARTRKISKRNATPAWADLAAIRDIYRQCEAISISTGIKHHVDHEIPLQGKLVCGLHVHNNLRIIPAVENHKKHNKFEVA